MDKFENVTSDGNEKAFKRGKRVPEGAVNLAWAKSPKLSPQKNIVVVDTSRIVDENASGARTSKKIMYANSLGILQDENGNQIIDDEYPAVSDVFTIDETNQDAPGYEYEPQHILPYIHVSRYFHVDFAGLTMGSGAMPYKDQAIKVVDGNGREYTFDDGTPKYRISIAPAHTTIDSSEVNGAYRVWAFVDTDTNENLYLTYNKVEITPEGELKNQDIDHVEILNPVPFFQYRPEESDVIDPDNRYQKIFSTKPVTLKEQVLDMPHPDKDGYKVYVPKKAIEDTRLFQLFRWRAKCEFLENYTVEERDATPRSIKAGVVVTNSHPESETPYSFYNLGKSDWNATNVNFTHGILGEFGEQNRADYWEVNFDTYSEEALKHFDILLWCPRSDFDFGPYAAKIEKFIANGGTMIIDTNNECWTQGLGIEPSCTLIPSTAARKGESGVYAFGDSDWIEPVDENHDFWHADEELGGWELGIDEWESISPFSAHNYSRYFQVVRNYTGGPWEIIMQTKNNSGSFRPIMMRRQHFAGRGQLIYSTMGFGKATNALFWHKTGRQRAGNTMDTSMEHLTFEGVPYYWLDVNGAFVEGAYKLLFNLSLMATANKVLDNRTETDYSSKWTYTSPWYSSWVIDGNVLSDYEKDKYEFIPAVTSAEDSVLTWQRKLSTKPMRQLIDESISAEDLRKVNLSQRVYSIEVTNTRVVTPTALGDASIPTAWTTASSPEFIVPADLGPHVIVDTEEKADYEAAQYIQYTYPPKQYSGQVSVQYVGTSQVGEPITTRWYATGTATRTPKNSDLPDDDTGDSTDPNAPVEITMSWATHGDKNYYQSGRAFDYGLSGQPNGIRLYTEDNYYAMGGGPNNNWPFWGSTARVGVFFSGDWVKFIQDFLNKMQFYGWYNSTVGYLAINGHFDGPTLTAVKQFQTKMHLRKIDGIVDAETWAAIGAQVLRMGEFLLGDYSETNHQRFYSWILQRLPKQRISDGLAVSHWAKRSDIEGGPSTIWETFAVQLPQTYKISGVTIVPFTEGATSTVWVGAIDVKTFVGVANLANYDASRAMMPQLFLRPADQELKRVSWTPRDGNTVIVTIGQDKPSGWGTSRMLGVRDIRIHAMVTNSTRPTTNTDTSGSEQVGMIEAGYATVYPGIPLTFWAKEQNFDTTRYTYTNINWSDIDITDPGVHGTITNGGLVHLTNSLIENLEETNYTYGPSFGTAGPGLCRSKNENGVMNPVPETGWISKNDGIKLLCKDDGTPYGFPPLPTDMGANEAARHYTEFKLNNMAKDQSVLMAFYDWARKEFIIDDNGNSSLSYIEYMRRGAHNIFIGLISSYQLETKLAIPADDAAPPLPHRWAMPVYGVSVKPNTQIAIEPLPPDLGSGDLWPLPIRTGKFNRRVAIRPHTSGPISGYLGTYQGTTVRAFYQVVEANAAGWSSIYGRPNTDIKEEHPLLLDDRIIQVKQAPILQVKEPSPFESDADPVRPVIKIYTRESISDDWELLPWTAIDDYNASTGVVHLKEDLLSFDPSLVRVDYTTSRPVFNFKQFDGNKLNLNPYPGHDRSLIGRAIYVYIVPAYVKDNMARTIPESVEDRTIRFTLDPSIFDSISPNYDPLAVQLGVVYITTALDIDDLILLDTRRRGGGAKDSMNIEEINRLVRESIGYWDIGHGTGMTYQKGGFVIIRLPAELKEQFPDERDIIEAIQRNITLGVQFKLEDLEGNSWS